MQVSKALIDAPRQGKRVHAVCGLVFLCLSSMHCSPGISSLWHGSTVSPVLLPPAWIERALITTDNAVSPFPRTDWHYPSGWLLFKHPNMTQQTTIAATALMALLLTGCTGYSPRDDLIGQHRAVLIARLGPPEREYPSGGMPKLHFPRGPAGWHTYFVCLDKSDRVTHWEQVLTEERFDRIRPGMSLAEVIDTIGISRIQNRLAGGRGHIWYYRYQNTQCRSFVIEFTDTDQVRGAGYIHRSGRRCGYVGP